MIAVLVTVVAVPAALVTVALGPAICVQLLLNKSFRIAREDETGPISWSVNIAPGR